MFDLRLWAARLFAALRPRRPPRPRPLQLEPLTDRVLLSADPGLATAPLGLAPVLLAGALRQIDAVGTEIEPSSSQAPASPSDLLPALVVRDGSSIYRLTQTGKDLLSVSRETAPSEGGPVYSAAVSVGDNGKYLDLTVAFGASAGFHISLIPTDDSSTDPSGGFTARVHSVAAAFQPSVDEVVVQVDISRHEFEGWLDEGAYALRLGAEVERVLEGNRPRTPEAVESVARTSESGGPAPADSPGAATPGALSSWLAGSNLDGRDPGPDRAREDGQADPATVEDAEVFALDLAAEPNALTPTDRPSPVAQAELAPLNGADRALVPVFVVAAQPPEAAPERPRREEAGLNQFVIGLGEPSADPGVPPPGQAASPADRLFAEKEATTEGSLRVLTPNTAPGPEEGASASGPDVSTGGK
jgi:hypothetical protein